MMKNNGATELLIERLRSEIQRRKRHLKCDEISQVCGDYSNLSIPGEEARQNVQESREGAKPRLKQIENALDRASAKNGVNGSWPRFVRTFWRNQEAINEALIKATRAFLETVDWMRGKFPLLESRLSNVEKKLKAQAHWSEEFQRVTLERERETEERSLRLFEKQTQLWSQVEEKLEEQATALIEIRRLLLELQQPSALEDGAPVGQENRENALESLSLKEQELSRRLQEVRTDITQQRERRD